MQLATALGVDVTGVCSSAKVDLVRAIGADHVLDLLDQPVGAVIAVERVDGVDLLGPEVVGGHRDGCQQWALACLMPHMPEHGLSQKVGQARALLSIVVVKSGGGFLHPCRAHCPRFP